MNDLYFWHNHNLQETTIPPFDKPPQGNRPPSSRPPSSGPRPSGPRPSSGGGYSSAPRPPRPPMRRPERPQEEGGLNINEQIRARQVRLIGEEGEQIGVVAIAEALRMAEEAGLDLVEISPNAEPPVCKVLDYGKYKYEQQKKAAEARKKQKVIEVKELKFRPNIDEHDYQVKVKAARRFLEAGDKVKVTLRFRGREMAHLDLGMNVMKRVKEELIDLAKVEMEARVEGRQAIMVLMPLIQK